ncbi:MAG: PepSY-like domain-containing protein [Ferruginibacter sp.]
MKKIIMMSTLVAIVTFSACAQKLDASKVPAAVKTAFAKQYPGVTPTWEKEDGKYEVTFKQNGNEISALYEANGTMTESEMEMKVTDLPASIQAYVAEHYKGKKVKSAAKITKANGTVNYEANVNGKDAMFDANGKFLKEVKD